MAEEVVEEWHSELEAIGGCGTVGATHVEHVELIADAETLLVALFGWGLFVEVDVALTDFIGAFAWE